MPFSIGGPQYGLNDLKVGVWVGNGTYSNVLDIFSAQLLDVRPEAESADLDGDDTVTATAVRTKKSTVTMRWGGVSTPVISLITGGALITGTAGGYNYSVTRFSNKKAPYIGVSGRALAEEGNGDTHMFIPKCKVSAPFNIRFEVNNFSIPELQLSAVVDENVLDDDGNPAFFDIIEHAQKVAVTLPPTYS